MLLKFCTPVPVVLLRTGVLFEGTGRVLSVGRKRIALRIYLPVFEMLLTKWALLTVGFGIGLAGFLRLQHPGPAKDTLFEELRPGVFRHLNDFPLLPAPFLPVGGELWNPITT